ncbi:hypothetical protein GCM10022393_41040 [Aquimarina addita]|uniref:Uncharacterized protein n=1 Tax=Aquimarina addita TaxID=870485 RepID=A0ABP6UX56_9FLAO
MLLYNPSQQAYHIEESKNDVILSSNGYKVLRSFSRYDSALTYYKQIIYNTKKVTDGTK